MKTSVNFYSFRDAFQASRPENFTYEGLSALFDYLEEWESSTGEELELDVIAICCDFNEDSWQNIASNYDVDLEGCEDDDAKQEAVADYLGHEGVYVAHVKGGFVYRAH